MRPNCDSRALSGQHGPAKRKKRPKSGAFWYFQHGVRKIRYRFLAQEPGVPDTYRFSDRYDEGDAIRLSLDFQHMSAASAHLPTAACRAWSR